MGHASVTITFDRYGHLMPGNEAETADLLDALLARSAASARAPAVGADGYAPGGDRAPSGRG